MTMYKENRKISMSALRTACIDNSWYTLGDCDEYDALLTKAGSLPNVSTSDLAELAEDIKAHSETDADITSIMFALAKVSNTFFAEA